MPYSSLYNIIEHSTYVFCHWKMLQYRISNKMELKGSATYCMVFIQSIQYWRNIQYDTQNIKYFQLNDGCFFWIYFVFRFVYNTLTNYCIGDSVNVLIVYDLFCALYLLRINLWRNYQISWYATTKNAFVSSQCPENGVTDSAWLCSFNKIFIFHMWLPFSTANEMEWREWNKIWW